LGIGPSIDLFASRLNFQIEKFVSWKADPLTSHIDAFTLCWTDLNFDALTLCWTDLNFYVFTLCWTDLNFDALTLCWTDLNFYVFTLCWTDLNFDAFTLCWTDLNFDAFTLCWTDLNFYAFPPFSLVDKVCQKIIADKAEGFVVAPYWTTQSWFPQLMRLCREPPYLIKTGRKSSCAGTQSRISSPILQETEFVGLPGVRTMFKKQGLSERVISILLKSWHSSTNKQYTSHILRWNNYVVEHDIDFFKPSVADVLEFLTLFFDSGCAYSALNTARSALSSFISVNNLPVGQHSLVKRFINGVFNMKPSFPRYTFTWDVNLVLKFLKSMDNFDNITLKWLTFKLAMLVALVSGQRCQTLHCLNLDNLDIFSDKAVFHITELLKHSRPGVYLKPIEK
jgi:hypothetical protein